MARDLAARLRQLRLSRGWTQAETAERAGVSLASYKRFERTGAISLQSLLRIALAVDRLDRFDQVFATPALHSLDALVAPKPPRQRAPRRRR